MSHLKILDFILLLLSKPQNDKLTRDEISIQLHSHSVASLYMRGVDIERSIERLLADNYIKEIKEHVSVEIFIAGTITYLSITSQGYAFIKSGGYYNTFSSELSLVAENRSLRLSQIELNKSVVDTNKKIVWLTGVIAFGTFIAAIYYCFEIYFFFHSCNP